MSDNEIIKAFETCYKGYDELLDKVCDILNRQQAEIKQLETIERFATKTIEKQSAEIEMLQKENDSIKYCYEQAKTYNNTLAESCEKNCKKFNMTTRANAIKEFAERLTSNLKKDLRLYGNCTYYDCVKHIDNLVKERTEENEK